MFCAAVVEGVDEAVSITAITEGRGKSGRRKSSPRGEIWVWKIRPQNKTPNPQTTLKNAAAESLKRMSASHALTAGM